MRKYATAAALGLSMLIAVPTLASAEEDGGKRLNVPRDQWLAPAEITDRLSSKGYKVSEIEADDGAYEVDAVKDGTRMELHVHPATGEILAGYDDD